MSHEEPDFIKSSAIMAAGTLVSRFTGLIRNLLTVAALGTALFADTLMSQTLFQLFSTSFWLVVH